MSLEKEKVPTALQSVTRRGRATAGPCLMGAVAASSASGGKRGTWSTLGRTAPTRSTLGGSSTFGQAKTLKVYRPRIEVYSTQRGHMVRLVALVTNNGYIQDSQKLGSVRGDAWSGTRASSI
eukprot:1195658-Prorocentrum_minimum.AAC.7